MKKLRKIAYFLAFGMLLLPHLNSVAHAQQMHTIENTDNASHDISHNASSTINNTDPCIDESCSPQEAPRDCLEQCLQTTKTAGEKVIALQNTSVPVVVPEMYAFNTHAQHAYNVRAHSTDPPDQKQIHLSTQKRE